MPCIFFSHALSFKNMAKVSITICTNNLNPASIRIRKTIHRPFNLIIKTRPSTP